MKCPRCQQENPAQASFCMTCGAGLARAKRSTVGGVRSSRRKRPKSEGPQLPDLEKRLAEALKREAEAVEQQTATSEILRVIAGSPTALQPVLDAVAESAARLCAAHDAAILRLDGDVLHSVAHHGPVPYIPGLVVPAIHGTVTGRSVLGRQTIQVADLQTEAEEFPESSALGRQLGHRTILSVPLLREGLPVGAIVLRRTEVQPFTDKQIALLKTFADQAVIAIENVRLFNETKEALERQTATGEILRVISTSPTDLTPVLESVARNAARLCEADDVSIIKAEDDGLTILFSLGPTSAFRGQRFPAIQSVTGQAIEERRTVHVRDLLADPSYEIRPEFQHFGWRSALAVPLLRDGVAIGTITARRSEVRPFSDHQITLLETFADQAVIAIENVRLFTETKEALEQQTATSEILRVISSSPTGIQPVLDAIAENAARVCGAADALIVRAEGDVIRRVAHFGKLPLLLPDTRPFTRYSMAGRAMLEGRTIHVADMGDPEAMREYPESSATLNYRTQLTVPLMREGGAIGAIIIRRVEASPFADKQLALLQTFADQAVIAIENVRLFTELQEKNRALTQAHAQVTESLEQQTATSEILRVISSSPTDVQPVFDTIVRSAVRLCDGVFGALFRFDGEMLYTGAEYNYTGEALEELHRVFPTRPTRALGTGRAILDRVAILIPDVEADPEYRHQVLTRAIGYRSGLFAPMLREDVPIGVIQVARAQPGPFSDTEIQLLKTFADQAVIAIENVRLFKELEARNRELTAALERQTATSDILQVISSSPTDIQPVFDAIAQSAARLCEGEFAVVARYDGDLLHLGSHAHASAEWTHYAQQVLPIRPDRRHILGRAILEGRVVHMPDVEADPEYDPVARQSLRVRSGLALPMLRERRPIGAIAVGRREVRPFTEQQIALLQTFADQAVIAIENVRLFKELQARNRDLSEALERQTATGEILDVISRSQTDVQAVFDTIVRSARALTSADIVALLRTDGTQILVAASDGEDSELIREATLRLYPMPLDRESLSGRAILSRTIQKTSDIETLPSPPKRSLDVARTARFRSQLTVPLLRAGEAIGAIGVSRREPGAFPDAQVELLKTFADQAVIAIENARLFNELQARTAELTRSVEQLTALGEVGRAVSSTLDLETVLTTIVSRAVQLSGLDGGVVFEYDAAAEEFVQRAMTETGETLAEARRATRIRKGEGVLGRTAITLEPVQVADISMPGAYEGRLRDNLIDSGIRAILAVPMVREDHLIGCLGVTRNSSGEFPAATVELLRTFATQSALAIQNARLFREIEQKSRELEAASRHKSEFLANMSHELRTPLNAVIGFSEVLSERMFGDLNEKQDEYLKDIHASGQHLLSLINDILDLSKIEAGKMELELSDFDLPMTIDNALMLVRERAARRSIALNTAVDERLGQIRADERKIRQVLLNLLSNAIKFTPEGGRIHVEARSVNESIEVSVTDTGVGIAPKDQEAVFEEFRQVGTADKKVEGTGLGLALSRKFIELHGGKIWVESQVGEGSTFTFTVPVRRGE